MDISKDTDSNNNLIKYKRLIRKPCISTLAWSKNNFDSTRGTNHNELEKTCINILSWLDNNSNPSIEKLEELRQLKGSFTDSIESLCLRLSDVKANELRIYKGKVKDNVFYYCENIVSGGWVKYTTTLELPQPVADHQEHLKDNQVPYDE